MPFKKKKKSLYLFAKCRYALNSLQFLVKPNSGIKISNTLIPFHTGYDYLDR